MTFLLYALLAAIVYAVGSLLLKRALLQGVGAWRMAFVCNLLLAAMAAPLFFLAAPPTPEARWYQPLVAGTAFFLGQIFTYLAINKGDVSVATPVLGTKVIFVALFTVLLIHLPIPWTLWAAALLTTTALAVLGSGTKSGEHHKFFTTLLYAGTSALSFSFTDVVTQKWSPAWGGSGFTARFLAVCGLLSFTLIPLFHGRLRDLPKSTWLWLGGGAFVLSSQGLLLYIVLGHFGHATEMNVVYNSRGLWTVLLVWFFGGWFANQERAEGGGAMVRRLIGSLLILAAIGLVLR